ncbi:hypothetical protein CCUS01_00717 [Colletotrichum cuscutae]|uniref:Uncharacterized protein n=1 Tax=Colletotrichum cuscutae TaxID=1209917 RepID=A0AAI9VEE5_9PEZI|nr:hypothetical protein CCUS01_00717 [Colletotrichum cuscutae]
MSKPRIAGGCSDDELILPFRSVPVERFGARLSLALGDINRRLYYLKEIIGNISSASPSGWAQNCQAIQEAAKISLISQASNTQRKPRADQPRRISGRSMFDLIPVLSLRLRLNSELEAANNQAYVVIMGIPPRNLSWNPVATNQSRTLPFFWPSSIHDFRRYEIFPDIPLTQDHADMPVIMRWIQIQPELTAPASKFARLIKVDTVNSHIGYDANFLASSKVRVSQINPEKLIVACNSDEPIVSNSKSSQYLAHLRERRPTGFDNSPAMFYNLADKPSVSWMTNMRLTTLVTVLSISITAQACSGYKYCHCYNSDVCTKAGYRTKYNSDFGHYEERCIKAGATGKDSSCRGKRVLHGHFITI